MVYRAARNIGAYPSLLSSVVEVYIVIIISYFGLSDIFFKTSYVIK